MELKPPRFLLAIHVQITLIIVASLVIVISASSRLERWVQQDYTITNLEAISQRVNAIASVLAVASPAEQNEIVEIANRANWHLSLAPLALSETFTKTVPDESYLDRFTDWLSPPDSETIPFKGWRTFLNGKRVVSARAGTTGLIVIEQLPDSFLRSDALAFGSNYLVALITLIVILSFFAIWTITYPLRRMATAAMRADISSGPTLFPEKGSIEIVALARALNGMQSRISRLVEARTRMLRGISHDLRTPLTRLRLRAERIGDGNARSAFLSDIGRIDQLLNESLNFLRDSHRTEELERVDLASLVRTVSDEFADIGHDITYSGPDRLIQQFRPVAMTRAVTNLCENATKYGTRVDVSLIIESGAIVVEVSDNGPGIPKQHLHRVTEPFYKIDAARGGADPGFGLGLSIVNEIVQSHQGRFELREGQPGLRARIILPRREA